MSATTDNSSNANTTSETPKISTKNKKLIKDIITLTIGVNLYVFGYTSLAKTHDFVPAGIYGLSVVLNKYMPFIALPLLNILVNTPLFVIAKKYVSSRFFFMNLYGMLLLSTLSAIYNINLHVNNPILGAMAAGALMGTGMGLVYNSSAGTGGVDIISTIVNLKYGIRIGVLSFSINFCIMMLAATKVTTDQLIASILMMFITSMAAENTLSMFNTRKEVKIITRKYDLIGQKLLSYNLRGTLFPAKGLYSRNDIGMIMVVATNYQLKQIENILFDNDPDGIMIVDNTFNVIGKSIRPRKVY